VSGPAAGRVPAEPRDPAVDGRTPPAVVVDDVAFTYPSGVLALDGVSLAVEAGETVAIVGQNGSGKSTLVRHLNGLLRPDRGHVLVQGADIGDRHVAEIARAVGLAFQNPDRQVFSGRAHVEVAFGPRNLGLRGAALDAAVGDALDAVGLADVADANPYDLGYSRRKLLGIASILAMRTPIVILDEPTTGQDLRGVARVRGLVRALAAEGRTVLAVSHDMRFVAETFGRVVVMREGRIILDDTPAGVFAEASWPVLASTYLEPPLAARVGARLGLGATPTDDALVEALVGLA
jgi:energy-coupling factor transport system ATP-binding protein